jgi:hypothetical protein
MISEDEWMAIWCEEFWNREPESIARLIVIWRNKMADEKQPCYLPGNFSDEEVVYHYGATYYQTLTKRVSESVTEDILDDTNSYLARIRQRSLE